MARRSNFEIKIRRRAFGKAVRNYRLLRNLTQEELAEFAELDRKTISRLENGLYSASLDNLWAIAYALNVSPEALLKPDAYLVKDLY
jgi:transcriptional regulator with XRE-family HTH domain